MLPSGVDEKWRCGMCYPMAIAISDRLGWPIVTLTVTTTTRPISRTQVVHAWTRAPDGRAFDAAGFFDEGQYVVGLLADRSRWRDKRTEEHPGSAAFLAHLSECYASEYGWERYIDRELPDLILAAATEVERYLVAEVSRDEAPTPAF